MTCPETMLRAMTRKSVPETKLARFGSKASQIKCGSLAQSEPDLLNGGAVLKIWRRSASGHTIGFPSWFKKLT
jgi:hypothetical protein